MTVDLYRAIRRTGAWGLLLAVITVLPPLRGFAAPIEPLKLSRSYELAIERSERIQKFDEQIKIAEADYKEALSALYPNIHLTASQRIRSNDDFGMNNHSDSDGGGTGNSRGSSSRGEHQFESALTVRQPIFSGFRDILLSQAAKSDVAATRLDVRRARESFFLDVAAVYFQIGLYEDDIKILSSEERTISDRIEELRKFLELGKSRDSEVLSAESDLADVRALREATRGFLAASKELFSFLVGIPASELAVGREPLPTVEKSVEPYLTRARTRVDLIAAETRRESAAKKLTAAERERWPSLSLEGNAYPYDDPDLNRDWDVLFRLDIPIFEGGAIDARVARSNALYRTAELDVQELKRIAERDVRTAYGNTQSLMGRLESLRALRDAATKNLASQRKDYELGVVTNLEVLQSIRDVQNARRRLLAAENELREQGARLEVAAGGIS